MQIYHSDIYQYIAPQPLWDMLTHMTPHREACLMVRTLDIERWKSAICFDGLREANFLPSVTFEFSIFRQQR